MQRNIGRRKTLIRRRSFIEEMEVRIALAADMHNFIEPGDVNGDGDVRPSDALTVINLVAQSDSNSKSLEGESVDGVFLGQVTINEQPTARRRRRSSIGWKNGTPT